MSLSSSRQSTTVQGALLFLLFLLHTSSFVNTESAAQPKRGPNDLNRFAFGLGKRGRGPADMKAFSFGLGKRGPTDLHGFSFGLGKRGNNEYNFPDLEEEEKRARGREDTNRWAFGIGRKRGPHDYRAFSFGLGKRDDIPTDLNRFSFGLGKRAPLEFEEEKRRQKGPSDLKSFNFGLGKRK